jgi:hypothetical protein
MVFKIFYGKITAICNAQHHSTEGYLAESIQSQTSRGSRVVIFDNSICEKSARASR